MNETSKQYLQVALAINNSLYALVLPLTVRRTIESGTITTVYKDGIDRLQQLYEKSELLNIGIEPRLQLLEYSSLKELLEAFREPENLVSIMQNWESHIGKMEELKKTFGEAKRDCLKSIIPFVDEIIIAKNKAKSLPVDDFPLYKFTYDEFDLSLKMNGRTIYRFKRNSRIVELIEEGLSGNKQKLKDGDYKNLKKFKSCLPLDEDVKNAFIWITKGDYRIRPSISPQMIKNASS